MSPLAIILVLVSALFHVGWNLLTKRHTAKEAFVGRLLAMVAAVGLVPAALSEGMAHCMTRTAWACAAGSGFCCGLYFYALARAYGSADFTVVYPVARSLPVLIIALGDVIAGRHVAGLGWAGMSLVVGGCILSPLHSFRDLTLRHYFNRGVFWMAVAALGVAGFTLFDKAAAGALAVPGPASALRYGYFMYLATFFTYRMFHHGLRAGGAVAGIAGWRLPLLAGVCTYGGYALILWAYQLVENASYVVAFRQVSIIIGVLLAFRLYGERGKAVRLAAALLITAGLIVIALWGR